VLRVAREWSLTTCVLTFTGDWSMNLASMIAYNLITAMFPILLVLLSLVGLLVQGHLREVSTAISGVFPEARQSNIAVTPCCAAWVSAHKVRVNRRARGGPGGVPSTASTRR